MSDSATTPTATAAIRDAKVLKSKLDHANLVITQHNPLEFRDPRPGAREYCRQVGWEKIAVYFKLAVRDDAEKFITANNLRGKDEEVDHIFEVRHFAAVFLYTIAEIIANGEEFYPEIADISFAVILVNHPHNLKSISKDFHKLKTSYFTPGNADPKFSPRSLKRLLEYLNSATLEFGKAVEGVADEVKGNEHHRVFKLKLLENLLSTPWCNYKDGQWDRILKEKVRFSKNMTLKEYVPDEFIDVENMFYDDDSV